ncbi:MAG TPA: TetR/AcrR family transcriptional regulator [Deltaproteobacteria bacterium]|nr:TetR/AcrR family transcriptional regulator [Deltaproteobacteria bacterium]
MQTRNRLRSDPRRERGQRSSGIRASGRDAEKNEGVRGPYARGVQRRRTLLEAVLKIVAVEGVGAVTHRAVAAEAGASLRATTYYFSTKEDMIREAFRFFSEQSLEQIDAISRHYRDREVGPEDAVEMLFKTIEKEWDNPNTSWAAEFELILAVAREPAFAPEYHAFQKRLDVGLQEMMRRIGSPRPVVHARIVLAFLRGFELEQLSRPGRRAWQRKLRSDLTHLVRALLTHRD